MSTDVKHLKTKKDKSICNLRRMHNLSCNGCVCYSACYGDYELYSGDNVYLITANIFKLLSNESKTAEHVAQVTGLNVNKVGLYRQIIKKGDYKDVRNKEDNV